MTKQEQASLRAEVAELRKLVMDLMAHGVTVTHVHRGPSLLEQQPVYPRPYTPQPYPWSPYQGATCSSAVTTDPNILMYNGSAA